MDPISFKQGLNQGRATMLGNMYVSPNIFGMEQQKRRGWGGRGGSCPPSVGNSEIFWKFFICFTFGTN